MHYSSQNLWAINTHQSLSLTACFKLEPIFNDGTVNIAMLLLTILRTQSNYYYIGTEQYGLWFADQICNWIYVKDCSWWGPNCRVYKVPYDNFITGLGYILAQSSHWAMTCIYNNYIDCCIYAASLNFNEWFYVYPFSHYFQINRRTHWQRGSTCTPQCMDY